MYAYIHVHTRTRIHVHTRMYKSSGPFPPPSVLAIFSRLAIYRHIASMCAFGWVGPGTRASTCPAGGARGLGLPRKKSRAEKPCFKPGKGGTIHVAPSPRRHPHGRGASSLRNLPPVREGNPGLRWANASLDSPCRVDPRSTAPERQQVPARENGSGP